MALTWARDAQSRALMVPLGCFCSHGLVKGLWLWVLNPRGNIQEGQAMTQAWGRGANHME